MDLTGVSMPTPLRRAITATKICAMDFEAKAPEGAPASEALNARVAQPTLLSIASGRHAYVLPFSDPRTAALVAALYQQPDLEIVMHNALYDAALMHHSRTARIETLRAKLRDSMICQFLLNEEHPKGLKEMVAAHLRHRMMTYEEATQDNPDAARMRDAHDRIVAVREAARKFPRERPWPTFEGPRVIRACDVRSYMARELERQWPADAVKELTDESGKTTVRRSWNAEKRRSRAEFKRAQEARLEEAFGPLTQLEYEAWSEQHVVVPARAVIAECEQLLEKRFVEYARDDSRYTLRLWLKLATILRKRGLGAWLDVECEVRRITVESTICGIPIDLAELERLREQLLPLIAEFQQRIATLTPGWTAPNGDPFNPNSDFHIRRFLFIEKRTPIPPFVRDRTTGCWLPRLTKTGTNWLAERGIAIDLERPETIPAVVVEKYLSVDSETLERVEHPLGMALLNLSVIEKLYGTYVVGNIESVRSHPERRLCGSFNSIGTGTGRLSSSGPNLQNIPSRKKPEIYDVKIASLGPKLRRSFRASPGMKLLICDQSQIELRIIAHFTNDEAMLGIYLEGVEVDGVYYFTGDIHLRTSLDLGIPRKLAKCLDGSTYVVVEGAGIRRIGDVLGRLEPGDHRPIPALRVADARGGWVGTSQGLRRDGRPCKTVVTSRGVVTCTADHRWMTTHGLKQADELRPGDVLPEAEIPSIDSIGGSPRTVRVNPFEKTIGSGPATMVLGRDWAYFAGLYQGDGSMVNDHTVVIAHDSADDAAPWRQAVYEAVRAVGLPASIDKAKRNTRVGSRVVSSYLKTLELGAKKGKEIKIPSWVSEGGRETIEAYLAGLFDTDGTIGESGVSMTTRCPIFAGQIAFLLRTLGVDLSIFPSWNHEYEKHCFEIRVRNGSVVNFHASIGRQMKHAGKVRDLAAFASVARSTHHKPTEVKLVLDAGDRTVYDFHVDNDDHLYLQGGFVGHNNVNFGFNYGMGPLKFARQIRLYLPGTTRYDVDKAKLWREGFFRSYPGVLSYTSSLNQQWKEGKTDFRMVSGRFRHFDADDKGITGGTVLNAKVQGSSADIVKVNMLIIDRYVRPLCPSLQLLFQVHDELGYQVAPEEAARAAILVKYVMEQHWFPNVRVPILAGAKLCDTWEEKDDDNVPEIGRYYAQIKGDDGALLDRVFDETNWSEYVRLDAAKRVTKKSAVAMLSPDDLRFCRTIVPEPTAVPELLPYWTAAVEQPL